MMTAVFAELDKSWSDWVKTNLANQVPPQSIAKTLCEKGYPMVALKLLQQFRLQPKSPLIDLSANRITLSDREISVLFSCTSPCVISFGDFLSRDECQQLIAYSENKLQGSKVINPSDGEFVKHQGRTSSSTGYRRGETALIARIEKRIAELTRWPIENGEGLQVLRYEDGGEYRPHVDYFDPQNASSADILKNGGQRVGTFLMYLSDVEAGGATAFPSLHFQIHPKAGMALYFSNTTIDGEIDSKALHAGIPVTQGVKYLATKWLREKAYQ